jgi:hypothetical protein
MADRTEEQEHRPETGERVLFALYLVLIFAGLAFFTVVGFLHR